MQALAAQQQQLRNLQTTCHIHQGFCYGISHELTASHDSREQDVNLRLGYGFGNGISLGITLAQPLKRHWHQGVSDDSRGPAAGLSVRYEQAIGDDARWFIEPAWSFSQYRADFTRPVLSGTEAGHGRSRLHGNAVSLTAGYAQTLPSQSQWQVYTALRHSDLQRDAYQESDSASFPASYEKVSLHDTALAVGASASLPLTDKLSVFADAEVEQRLGSNTPTYRANMPYVGAAVMQDKPAPTRANARVGVNYALTPQLNVQFSPSVGSGFSSKGYWGTYLGVKGSF